MGYGLLALLVHYTSPTLGYGHFGPIYLQPWGFLAFSPSWALMLLLGQWDLQAPWPYLLPRPSSPLLCYQALQPSILSLGPLTPLSLGQLGPPYLRLVPSTNCQTFPSHKSAGPPTIRLRSQPKGSLPPDILGHFPSSKFRCSLPFSCLDKTPFLSQVLDLYIPQAQPPSSQVPCLIAAWAISRTFSPLIVTA